MNLYGIDPSVSTLVDPEDKNNILVDKEKIDCIIAEHFSKHFQDVNRALDDPSLQHTNFHVSVNEIRKIMS